MKAQRIWQKPKRWSHSENPRKEEEALQWHFHAVENYWIKTTGERRVIRLQRNSTGLAAAEKSSFPKWVANLWFQMASKQASWTDPSKRSTTSRFFFLFLLTPSKSTSRKELHSYSGSFLNGKERHCWTNNNRISPFSKPHQILQQTSVRRTCCMPPGCREFVVGRRIRV